jgi:hypothetical protein
MLRYDRLQSLHRQDIIKNIIISDAKEREHIESFARRSYNILGTPNPPASSPKEMQLSPVVITNVPFSLSGCMFSGHDLVSMLNRAVAAIIYLNRRSRL